MQAKYLLDSILTIMININLYLYYYTPYATLATSQRFGGVIIVLHFLLHEHSFGSFQESAQYE